MSQNPVIHIHAGLPKTGSTALQKFLYQNRFLLRPAGLLVPETGMTEGGAHHPFFFEAGGLNPFERSAAVNDLEAEIRDSGARAVLLSSEFVYGVLRWGFAGKALRRLRRRGFELRFHVFIRPQTDFAVSAYPEFLRNMVVGVRFPAFVERIFLPYAGDYRTFTSAMQPFSDVPVNLIPYNRAARREGVWWKLIEATGTAIADPEVYAIPGEVNRSLGPAGVSALEQALMRIERTGMVARWGHRKAVRSALLYATHGVSGEETRFNPLMRNERAKLWESCREANDSLAMEAWGMPWDEVFPDEAGERPRKEIFRREAASEEMIAHHDWMVRHFYRTAKRKIAAVERKAAELSPVQRLRRAVGRPVDRLADRVMKSLIKGA